MTGHNRYWQVEKHAKWTSNTGANIVGWGPTSKTSIRLHRSAHEGLDEVRARGCGRRQCQSMDVNAWAAPALATLWQPTPSNLPLTRPWPRAVRLHTGGWHTLTETWASGPLLAEAASAMHAQR